MTPVVLVHGGGFDSRCWELVVPLLRTPAIAVDLPGRGRHPAPLDGVTFERCAASVLGDVDAAGFDEVVLVGHSLAGCSMPATIGLLGDRVRHAVFIACTVPEDGRSAFDTLDPAIQEMILAAGHIEPRPMDASIADMVLGNDLTGDQVQWCVERLTTEAVGLTREPVDLSPLRSDVARTWVRTLHDLIIEPAKQVRFAENLGDCPIVDIDAGHMCMVGRPAELAAIINEIAARP